MGSFNIRPYFGAIGECRPRVDKIGGNIVEDVIKTATACSYHNRELVLNPDFPLVSPKSSLTPGHGDELK
jgi:hypothetical protein